MDSNLDTSHESTQHRLLSAIIESAGDDAALKLLNQEQKFSQVELDSALISACHRGYKFLMFELVHLGADLQVKDRHGNTPLLICVENGFTNMARFLIRRKSDVNVGNYFGDTALILAIRPVGSVEMLKILLQQEGINVNHQNKAGYTALMKAIEAMDIDAVKMLLDSTKNTEEALDKITNSKGKTAQQLADKLDLGNVVKLLSKHKRKDKNLVLAAAEACDVDSFDIFLDCQFCALTRDSYVKHAFEAVFIKHDKNRKNFSENEEEMINRLLECGANASTCNYKFSPAMIATKVGSCNVLRMLLQYGAYPEPGRGKSLEVVLNTAAELGNIHIIGFLFEHYPCLNAEQGLPMPAVNSHNRNRIRCFSNGDLKSAFISAMSTDSKRYIRYLVQNYSVRIKNCFPAQDMANFLVSAARKGHLETIDLLLDAGANINGMDKNKKTPLMEAKNAEVVDFLVQRGAVSRHKKETGN